MWRYYQFDVVWMKKDDLKAAFLMGYSSGVYDGYRITNKKNKAMYTKIANVTSFSNEEFDHNIEFRYHNYYGWSSKVTLRENDNFSNSFILPSRNSASSQNSPRR